MHTVNLNTFNQWYSQINVIKPNLKKTCVKLVPSILIVFTQIRKYMLIDLSAAYKMIQFFNFEQKSIIPDSRYLYM